MPPVTLQHRITIYGFQPEDAFPDCFVQMLSEVTPVHCVYSLNSRMEAVLKTASLWQVTAYLTTQGADLFGVARPYDCDPLVDFLTTGPSLKHPSHLHYRYIPKEDRPTLHGLIERLVVEPLFPEEQQSWVYALKRLQTFSGPLLIVFVH